MVLLFMLLIITYMLGFELVLIGLGILVGIITAIYLLVVAWYLVTGLLNICFELKQGIFNLIKQRRGVK